MAKRKIKVTKKRRKAQQKVRRQLSEVSRSFVSHQAKEDGSSARHAPLAVKDNGNITHTCADHGVTFGSGVTVTIGEYEFARIEVRVHQAGDNRDRLYEESKSVAMEFLEREEADATGLPRESQPYGVLTGERREVEVLCGLTLRAASGTRKVDVGLKEVLDPDEKPGDGLERCKIWLDHRLRSERNRLLGIEA